MSHQHGDGTEGTVEIINTPRREQPGREMVDACVWTRQCSGWKTTMQVGMADECLLFSISFATEMKFKVKGRSRPPSKRL